jgi:Na+/phosphate symporter
MGQRTGRVLRWAGALLIIGSFLYHPWEESDAGSFGIALFGFIIYCSGWALASSAVRPHEGSADHEAEE